MSDGLRRFSSRLLGVPAAPVQEIPTRRRQQNTRASQPVAAEELRPARKGAAGRQNWAYFDTVREERVRDSGIGGDSRLSTDDTQAVTKDEREGDPTPRKESAASLQWDDEDFALIPEEEGSPTNGDGQLCGRCSRPISAQSGRVSSRENEEAAASHRGPGWSGVTDNPVRSGQGSSQEDEEAAGSCHSETISSWDPEEDLLEATRIRGQGGVRNEETSSGPSLSSRGSEDGRNRMADDEAANRRAPPQLKFRSPPIFSGKKDEDAADWMDRYISIGQYNRWEEEELRDNFGMYLEGTARKWFRCIDVPDQWDDVNGPVRVQGLKSMFLEEFQQESYGRYQEAKLRKRKQGIDEPGVEYYYEIIDLCRIVDPLMPEGTKLDYLFRGLKPSLLEKIWVKNPRTCAQLLTEIKLHTEAAEMANQEEWSVSVLGTEKASKAPWKKVGAEEREESRPLSN